MEINELLAVHGGSSTVVDLRTCAFNHDAHPFLSNQSNQSSKESSNQSQL